MVQSEPSSLNQNGYCNAFCSSCIILHTLRPCRHALHQARLWVQPDQKDCRNAFCFSCIIVHPPRPCRPAFDQVPVWVQVKAPKAPKGGGDKAKSAGAVDTEAWRNSDPYSFLPAPSANNVVSCVLMYDSRNAVAMHAFHATVHLKADRAPLALCELNSSTIKRCHCDCLWLSCWNIVRHGLPWKCVVSHCKHCVQPPWQTAYKASCSIALFG